MELLTAWRDWKFGSRPYLLQGLNRNYYARQGRDPSWHIRVQRWDAERRHHKVYDQLDFTHAFECFVNTYQAVNMAAAHKGMVDIGVKDSEVLVFSNLMDSKSLFLTANADTVYFVGFINLSGGPMVMETPPNALGTLDDFWWRWVTDFGLPTPDRGVGSGPRPLAHPQQRRSTVNHHQEISGNSRWLVAYQLESRLRPCQSASRVCGTTL